MAEIDWLGFARIEALGAGEDPGGSGTFDTGIDEPLEVVAWAPCVFRLRFGGRRLPDYGLLAETTPLLETRIEELADGTRRVEAGDATLEIRQGPLRVRLLRRGEPILESITDLHFRGWTRLPTFGRGPQGWTASFALADGEPVYGLGEKFGRLDKRGELVISRAEDALGVNTELAYKNMPFAWSPRGWGLLVHTPARVMHGVGFGRWSHRSYAIVAEDEALDLFLFAADSPAAMLDVFTRLTGRPASVPEWSLGPWLSKAYYRTPDEALAAAREIRARDIPCDVIVFDGRAWQDTPSRFRFEFDPLRFADARATLAELKALGFRVCCWEYPLVSAGGPHFAAFAAKGWLLRRRDGQPCMYQWDTKPGTSPFGSVLTPLPPSGLVDFTHPDAYAWWRDAHRPLFELGVDVFKPDFGEQVPDDCIAHNSDSGARLHNVWPVLYNRCVFEATARYGSGVPMVWSRDGWIGAQTLPIQWGGDPQSDWGGFAASIRGGLSWGMCGVPCWASDVGGFYGPQPDAELFLRWLAQAVFGSHLRFHGVGPREPWAFGPEAEALARGWLRRREALRPYLMRTIEEATRTGLPVMRAMPLAFPGDRAAAACETQYLCGPDLLVAPIVRPGGDCDLWLPDGDWTGFFDGAPVAGGRALALRGVSLDRLPVFVRAGSRDPSVLAARAPLA